MDEVPSRSPQELCRCPQEMTRTVKCCFPSCVGGSDIASARPCGFFGKTPSYSQAACAVPSAQGLASQLGSGQGSQNLSLSLQSSRDRAAAPLPLKGIPWGPEANICDEVGSWVTNPIITALKSGCRGTIGERKEAETKTQWDHSLAGRQEPEGRNREEEGTLSEISFCSDLIFGTILMLMFQK